MPVTADLLKKVKGEIPFLVETGTHRGDGVREGLAAGFERVYSCDNSEFAYGWASCRFQHDNHLVHLALMDSPEFIRWMFDNVRDQPFVFFLDAHWCGGNGEMDGADRYLQAPAPLLGELDVIAGSGRTDHVILIDDVRMFGSDVFPAHQDVVARLRNINPEYRITYEDCEFQGDVMVALP